MGLCLRRQFSKEFFFPATLALAIALTGCGGGLSKSTGGSTAGGGTTQTPPPPAATLQTSVNHIVLFMQENRSFDHYFGQLNAYRTSKGLDNEVDDLSKAGNVSLETWDGSPNVSPYKMNTACIGDLSSSWVEAHIDMDLHHQNNIGNPPPMDGFAFTAGGFAQHDPSAGGFDVAGKRAMGYYDDGQLPFYYWAATTFATSDRWFSAVPARTQLNRMYFLAATSNGYAFPGGPSDGHPALNMDGVKSIFELLQDNNITWKVYVTNGFVAGKSAGSTYMTYFPAFTNAHLDHFADASTFATDAANGTLPQVALIESGYESGEDEHPLNPVDQGARYALSLVKALMNSPSWKNSVMFITFDEGGGLYDHVPPMQTVNPDGKTPQLLPTDPPGDFTITGFRVPLMVISPFAKAGYVAHTPADFTALLKFVETRFGLPSLTKRDAFQPDMTEYFDWSAPNLNSTSPPDQPTLPCYFDHLP